MALYMSAEKFLAKDLGGRYQEGGTPEATKRLAEITVDPKTVVLTKKVDPASVGAPKPAVDLKPGTYKYQAKLAMGGQEMALNISTTIKEENGAWTVTDVREPPMGQATDTAPLQKGSLILLTRNLHHAPLTLNTHLTEH